MSEKLGLATLEEDPSPFLQQAGAPHMRAHEYSQDTALTIDVEVKRLLDQALQQARRLINQNKSFVEEGAQYLIQKETLDEETIKKLWQKHTGTKPPKPSPGLALGQPILL
jgi:cell division protease FtsH